MRNSIFRKTNFTKFIASLFLFGMIIVTASCTDYLNELNVNDPERTVNDPEVNDPEKKVNDPEVNDPEKKVNDPEVNDPE